MALFAHSDDFVFASYLIRLVPDPTLVDPAFLNSYFNRAPVKARLKAIASRGVSQANINATKLLVFSVALPPIEGQHEAEGVSDVAELNAILDRAVKLKEMMKAADRVDGIARHVAEHFSSTGGPMGFKAFLVAVDREACAIYKQALDRYLPSDYSRVVYSSSNSDSELLKQYRIDEDEERVVREDFRTKDKLPKVLIVTEKLLTGFDAPILYCLYLDKPMRDHVLLQTIARVNRPYEDEDELVKPYGFILVTCQVIHPHVFN